MKSAVIALLLCATAASTGGQNVIENTNAASVLKSNLDSQYQLWSKREPKGSTTSWLVTTNGHQLLYHMTNHTSGSNWIVYGILPISLPYTFNDANSGISFRVENDGRHITAIASDGTVLWNRDPFADAHLKFYRTETPKIIFIGKSNKQGEDYWAKKGKQVIGITYNSSQFGDVDIKTGDFFFGGQD